MLHGLAHGAGRYLVEGNALNAVVLAGARHLGGDVIGDGLALAVRVRGQVDLLRLLGGLLEFFDDLFLAGDDAVLGLESVFDINAQLFLGQVPHVPHGRLDHKTLTEDLVDGLRLCG